MKEPKQSQQTHRGTDVTDHLDSIPAACSSDMLLRARRRALAAMLKNPKPGKGLDPEQRLFFEELRDLDHLRAQHLAECAVCSLLVRETGRVR